MKDIITGLSFAPLTHLTKELQQAVLRPVPGKSESTANTTIAKATATAARTAEAVPAPLPTVALVESTVGALPKGTPQVFFAEVLRKLSSSAKGRLEKERLVIVTRDSLLVYTAEGGYIKRRVSLRDISAMYITFYGGTQNNAPKGKEQEGKLQTQVFASVGFVVPAAYDLAFDVAFVPGTTTGNAEKTPRTGRGTTPRGGTVAAAALVVPTPARSSGRGVQFAEAQAAPNASSSNSNPKVPPLKLGLVSPNGANAIPMAAPTVVAAATVATSSLSATPSLERKEAAAAFTNVAASETAARQLVWSLVRVVTILRRRVPGIANELRVAMLPWTSGSGGPLHQSSAVLRLKKDPKAVHMPVVPPSIDIVAEEADKQRREMDAKIHIEEVVGDLLNELEKYRHECWDERNAAYTTMMRQVAIVCAAYEKDAFSLKTTSRAVERLRRFNDKRESKLTADEGSAQREQMAALSDAAEAQQHHNCVLKELRDAVMAAESRHAALLSEAQEQRIAFVETMRHCDEEECIFREKVSQAKALCEDCRRLPTSQELQSEIDSLHRTRCALQTQLKDNAGLDMKETELRGTVQRLTNEHQSLEEEILTAKRVLREAEQRTVQLFGDVSAVLAKRNRLTKTICWRGAKRKNMEAESAHLEATVAHQTQLIGLLQLRLETFDTEHELVADCAREAAVHQSIAASVSTATVAATREFLQDEQQFEGTIENIVQQQRAVIRDATSYCSPTLR